MKIIIHGKAKSGAPFELTYDQKDTHAVRKIKPVEGVVQLSACLGLSCASAEAAIQLADMTVAGLSIKDYIIC